MRQLKLAKAGDLGARDAVFERYRPRVLRAIRLRMGPELERLASAEDVLQDTMVTWLVQFEKFTPEYRGSLFAWLDRIAARKVKDLRDKHRVRGTTVSIGASGGENSPTVVASIDVPSNDPGPSTLHLAQELRSRFDSAVAALPERERDLVILRCYLEIDWADITTQLGYPNSQAGQMALTRARKKLRASLGMSSS